MKEKIIIILFLILVLVEGIYCFQLNKQVKEKDNIIQIEKSEKGKYTNINQDAQISALKKENKALYDSIKSYRDEVSFLTQYHYTKEYKTDTVYVSKQNEIKEKIKTYTYSNKVNNDSLNYKLLIGSVAEPKWYSLDITVNDKFTIVNRNVGGANQTTITSDNNGDIKDVTVFNKKKTSFWDNFSIGPTIMVGYGLMHKDFDVGVGIGITYNIW